MASLWPGTEGPVIRYISAQPSATWRKRQRRRVVLLGSTGSIGRSALDVIAGSPESFQVVGLACANSVDRLLAQALANGRPEWLAVLNEEAAARLRSMLPADYAPQILTGPEGYRQIASLPEADTVLSAQVGAAGLAGTLAAALAGKVICLANKESLVLAGELLRVVCADTGASILPVDSEHFAIFECLAGRGDDASRLILTASGGPFRGRSAEEIAKATPAMALKHPNWNMGAKITIDSATLMNKALEFIEACQLYGVSPDRIEVLVHPQSIVHSLVAFRDGSQLAQLGVPDMRLPIGACMLWPRVDRPLEQELDLAAAGTLTFERPDSSVFPAISLAKRAMSVRSGMNVVLNGANEAAVELFLSEKCSFPAISGSVAAAMEAHLQSLRLKGEGESRSPFSTSGGIAALSGERLAEAAWNSLRNITELGDWARKFVRGYVAGEGLSKC